MSEAGLSPALPTDIIMVIRTYPIRVAGNSGPMPSEISWPILAREINDKRTIAGLDPIVSERAIAAFEEAVRRSASAFKLPDGSDGLDQHAWADRVRHRTTLSELNKAALNALDDETRSDLLALFEMTTVTKKMRRVARLDEGSVITAARQVRPHRVALTFMNYEFPQRWFTMDPVTDEEEMYIHNIRAMCEAEVFAVSRGPADHHIIEVGG
jgi:adenylosuccinate synthase